MRLRLRARPSALPSEITLSHRNCGSVQDAYSLRCTPQVHGITHDTLAFTHGVLETEINSATVRALVSGRWKRGGRTREREMERGARGRGELGGARDATTNRHPSPSPPMSPQQDNPLVLEEGLDEQGHPTGDIISGGNFHGEYPAKAMDYVAIAVHELANISERRIER